LDWARQEYVAADLSPRWGSYVSPLPTHGLRRGLHSAAAPRLWGRSHCSFPSAVELGHRHLTPSGAVASRNCWPDCQRSISCR